jgi:acyl carrier protein
VTESLLATLSRLALRRFGTKAAALAPNDDLFEVLGIDSLQALDLLTDLEEEFSVEIPDYEVQGVNTLAGLAEVIGRRR